ncbi:MAG: SPOR domain-containing protein [Acidobacteriota bacterium]
MKGKLTPKQSYVLYTAWIVVVFGLFLLGLYWGKGQVTGLSQEISTQPVGAVAPAASETQAPGRLDLANRETTPAGGSQQPPPPLPASPAGGPSDAAVAPPAEPPLPAASRAKEIYSIQVGALNTEEEARKVIVRLQTRGYTGILDKPLSQKDPYYRVRVGSYLTREEAARAEALLKDEGFLTFIKKIK